MYIVILHFSTYIYLMQIQAIAERSEVWVCYRQFAGFVGSNHDGALDVCLL